MERNSYLIDRKFNEYLLPTLAMSASLFLASIVDSIMVGNLLGANALAAVNLTTPIVSIKNVIFSIFIYGGSTLAVGYSSRRNLLQADKAFTISICIGTFVSALAALLGSVFAAPTAQLLSVGKSELYPYVLAYLVPCWISGPVIVVNSGMAAYARTDGMRTIASLLPIVSNVINLLFDYILMRFTPMGVAGAGWATVLGYLFGSVLLISYFRSGERNFHFTRVSLRDLPVAKELLTTGLPTALLQACNFLRILVVNNIVLRTVGIIGSQVVTVCLSALTVSMIFSGGIGNTILPLGAALYGEQDNRGLKFLLKKSLILCTAACLAILVLFELFPVQIGGIYGVRSPEAAAMLRKAFRLFSLSIPFSGLAYVIRSFYQCTGQKAASSLFTALEGAVVAVPVIFLCALLGDTALWLSFTVAEVLSLAIMAFVMRGRARKAGKENLLMLDPETEGTTLDFSVDGVVESAVTASERVQEFCLAAGVTRREANAIAVSAEELCVNSAKYALGTKKIDVFTKITPEHVILRVRDNGKLFNPTEYIDESDKEITGLKLIRDLGAKLEYSRVIGFNETIITIERKKGENFTT